MRAMATTVGYNVVDVLKRSTIDGNLLTLPQVDGKTYRQVDDVLQRLGGKWNRGRKAHVFETDPSASIRGVIETFSIAPKNATAFFPTPASVVYHITDGLSLWADVMSNDMPKPITVLEPSAGDGGIIGPVLRDSLCHLPVSTTLVEVDPGRAAILRSSFPDATVIEGSFLDAVLSSYSVIVANPPFSVPDDKLAWVTHLERMVKLVAPGGFLAVVLPAAYSYRKLKRLQAIQAVLEKWDEYEVEPMAAGAFAESGTEVATVIVSAYRPLGDR